MQDLFGRLFILMGTKMQEKYIEDIFNLKHINKVLRIGTRIEDIYIA